MTSFRLSGFVLVSFVASTLAASSAQAERVSCAITTDGSWVCDGVTTCSDRRDCIGDPGTENLFCLAPNPTRPDQRECMLPCTTMFGCGSASDCPVIGPVGSTLAPFCQDASDGTSICTYHGTAPPNQRITYCADGGATILTHYLSACQTLPRAAGDPPVYTQDYFEGDCDGDGCPNGADTDPCALPATGASCAISTEPARSPFCPPLQPLACAPGSGGLVCEDARPCAGVGSACGAVSICEDGWSDGPRCRPSCSTLILCQSAATGRMPEPCPEFDGSAGFCVPSPVSIAGYPGYDGACVYVPSFVDATCSASTPSATCFLLPGTSTVTTNFFLGDCDGDGIPNGCDSMRCVPGSAADGCVPVPGDGCAATLAMPDAGIVDAGGSTTDAGDTMPDAGGEPSPDGSLTTDDSGTTSDSGTQAFDAGVTDNDASGGSFTGGGGCRCSAAGGDRGGLAGLGLAVLALGVTFARRRRR